MVVCQVQITPMMLWLKTFYQIALGRVFGAGRKPNLLIFTLLAVIPFLLTHISLNPILSPARNGFLSKG